MQPITRTVPVPGWAAGVGVGVGEPARPAGVGVGVAPPCPAGVGVAVAAAGRVFVAVGVTVDVGVAVAVLVGVGNGVAVFVGVKVAVGRGMGVGSSNRKFARALELPALHTAATLMVTSCPGEPVTVNVPLRFPPAVEPEPDACPPGTDETVTIPPLHQPLPESVPLTDGAGPEDGLSASVVGTDWARARATRPGVPWYGGIDTARIAATINTLTHDENRFIAHLRPLGQLWPVQHHRGPRPPPRSSARPAARPHPTTRLPV